MHITLPGREKTLDNRRQILLEYRLGEESFQPVAMKWNGCQWELPKTVSIPNNADLDYRFIDRQPGQPDRMILSDALIKNGFNHVPANSPDPSSLGATVLVFRDSLVTPDQLAEYIRMAKEGDKIRSKRTSFNQFGGTDRANAFISQLCRSFGIKIVEDRPLIGGDRISSHGYWPPSLFQPNSKISTPSGFERMALENLQNGARMCFDGAFVNQGFNGIHYLSNLHWRTDSPFLDWFSYGELNQYPHHPLKLGILPVKADSLTGEDVANHAAWNIRVIDPLNKKDAEGPCTIELYDPRLERADGTKRPISETRHVIITNSQDSVQNYRFPVPQKMAELLKKASAISNANARAEAIHTILRKGNFDFTIRIHDNSGYNWDGQVDVKKINIHNADVLDYIRDACDYWTDKVDRLYTAKVAEALNRAHSQNGRMNEADACRAIAAITRKSLEDTQGLLPALERKGLHGATENPITLDSIRKALAEHKDAARKSQSIPTATQIAEDLRKNFHQGTLPAPPMMQVLLNTPRLKQLLLQGEKPIWAEWIENNTPSRLKPLFSKLRNLLSRFAPLQRVMDWLMPRPFYKQLEMKLEKSLSPALKAKLNDPILGHLFYEEIGRSIYLSLLTGKFIPPNASDQELNPEALALQYARRIPYITQAPPNVAAQLLNRFLLEKLQTFNTALLNAPLEKMLKGITPESAALARYVLHQRKLGLHWRIDALKDLGDMDGVRALPDELRTAKLFEEIHQVKSIMAHIAQGIRSPFPQSVIKAEITDLHKFTSLENVNKLLAFLMKDNVINGIPNFTWLFASGHKAVRMAPRPEGEGESQLTPAEFLKNKLKPMMQVLPMDQTLLFQNMTASHDMSTSLFGLLLHPHQARYDYYSWLELNARGDAKHRGVFHLALNELQYKSQLGFLSQGLPKESFEQLRQLSGKAEIIKQLSPAIQPYLDPPDKRTDPLDKRPVPAEIKRRYLEELFRLIQPSDLGLSSEQHRQMHQALHKLILEPSETKALRGKLSNTFQQLCGNPQPLADLLQGDLKKATATLNKLAPAFDKALWELIQNLPSDSRRWLGYQQLDKVIDWAIEKLPEHCLDEEQKSAFKQALYNETIKPALEQYKRIVALQIAVPGDPTFYLPDLLGQAGGEDLKNMYLGNRELIRYDWLKSNPVIRQYCNELAAIIRQRHENNVLNNGHLELPLDPERSEAEKAALNKYPILPLIRDNGEDQAISLINFGIQQEGFQDPNNAWNSWMMSQQSPFYPEIRSNKPKVQDYRLNLKHLGIPVGTLYKSVDPEAQGKEYYVVNKDYQLVGRDNPAYGIDIGIARTLVRVNKARKAE